MLRTLSLKGSKTVRQPLLTGIFSFQNMNNNELDRLYGGNSFIKKTMEPACNFDGSCGTAEEAGRVCRNKESILRDVFQRAKSLGTWIEVEPLVREMIGNGQENDVFVAKDGLSVIKLNNFGLLPKAATSLAGFVHRLISHNKLFPEDAYTIIGFALNSGNEPCVVLRQPYIKAERYATDEEIDGFLEEHGYTVDMDDIWFDGTYEISDVKPTNVLLDQKGNLHFIDAVVNEVSFKIDMINKISIKHYRKQKTKG